jgi:hypothetical protein
MCQPGPVNGAPDLSCGAALPVRFPVALFLGRTHSCACCGSALPPRRRSLECTSPSRRRKPEAGRGSRARRLRRTRSRCAPHPRRQPTATATDCHKPPPHAPHVLPPAAAVRRRPGQGADRQPAVQIIQHRTSRQTVVVQSREGRGWWLPGGGVSAGQTLAEAAVAVRALPGRLSALSVPHNKSGVYGAFVWARRALNSQKRHFPARAGRPARRRLRGACAPPPSPWAAKFRGQAANNLPKQHRNNG